MSKKELQRFCIGCGKPFTPCHPFHDEYFHDSICKFKYQERQGKEHEHDNSY
jgi:hypothetical protein